jgi:hypothetical protein
MIHRQFVLSCLVEVRNYLEQVTSRGERRGEETGLQNLTRTEQIEVLDDIRNARQLKGWSPVVRKNPIRRPSDRDAGTYLFGFRELENPRVQPRRQKTLLSRTDRVPS